MINGKMNDYKEKLDRCSIPSREVSILCSYLDITLLFSSYVYLIFHGNYFINIILQLYFINIIVDEPTWRCHQNPFIGALGIPWKFFNHMLVPQVNELSCHSNRARAIRILS